MTQNCYNCPNLAICPYTNLSAGVANAISKKSPCGIKLLGNYKKKERNVLPLYIQEEGSDVLRQQAYTTLTKIMATQGASFINMD